MVLIHAGAEPVRAVLRYERAAVLQGEWWRLVSAHLTHADTYHLLLNLAGLGLLYLLFAGCYSLAGWLAMAAFSAAGVAYGLVFYEPQLDWYLGLSGVLHGLLAAGAVAWWRREPPLLALALSALLVGKLGWEQWQGAWVLAGSLPVVVNAHLYGALGGALGAAVLTGWQRLQRSAPGPAGG